MRVMRHFWPPVEILLTEVLYFIIIVCISAYIYYRTREIYELSKHKGIRHFRNIFLYFAIAYAFRLALISLPLLSELFLYMPPITFRLLSLFLFSFFSTMAILSVILSISIRQIGIDTSIVEISMYVFSFFSSVLAFLSGSHNILILLQTAAFLVALLILIFRKDKHTQGISQNKITSVLLFVFWVANTLAISRRFLPIEAKIAMYIISIGVFMSILVRVWKRLGHGKEKRQA